MPPIILQVLLQRVDLLVSWQGNRYALELKMKKQYRLGLREGWMAVFDRDPAVSWDTKLTWRTLSEEGKTLQVMGL